MANYIKLIVLGIVVLMSLYAANFARDLAYMVNALTVALAAGVVFIYVLRNTDEPRDTRDLSGEYMDGVVRYGVIATALWGVVGFLVGTFIAFQLAFPQLNFEWAEGILNFRSPSSAAYQRRDFRLRRQRVDLYLVLRGAAYIGGAALGR
jgi:cytochrome c oxidase cbb3-type subunit 1